MTSFCQPLGIQSMISFALFQKEGDELSVLSVVEEIISEKCLVSVSDITFINQISIFRFTVMLCHCRRNDRESKGIAL